MTTPPPRERTHSELEQRDGVAAALARSVRDTATLAGCGIYLGKGDGGWAWAGAERSTLVLGPSRSGKTSSVVIPNVLAAPGSVVSTSTKPDVMEQTSRARRHAGWTLLYDPSGEVATPSGVVRVGWSPLGNSEQWDGALAVADAMVGATRRRGGMVNASESHWTERATSLLAPLLHAAAIDRRPMRSVLSWVDRHDGAVALRTLSDRPVDQQAPADVLAGILATDDREQSGIWSTASGVLAAYRSSGALASTEPPYLDPAAFCDGAHTLYVCATGRQQQLLAPLVVGVLDDIKDAAYRRAARDRSGPPVVFALDEVANISPIPELPSIVSEGAGQGLLTLACLQDLSQARARWGREADSFLSLFATTMVLGGIADMPTLESLSALGGEEEVLTRTVGTSQGGDGRLRPSLSVTGTLRRRLPVDVIARGRPGAALAVDARNRMGWVGLTPAHSTPPWRDLVGGRQRGRQPGLSAGRGADIERSFSSPWPGQPGR